MSSQRDFMVCHMCKGKQRKYCCSHSLKVGPCACIHAHLSWEIGQTSLQQGQEADGPLFTAYPTLHLLKDEGGNCRGTRMKPRLVVGPSGERFIRPVLAAFPQQQYNVHANRAPNLYSKSKQGRCGFVHCHCSVLDHSVN